MDSFICKQDGTDSYEFHSRSSGLNPGKIPQKKVTTSIDCRTVPYKVLGTTGIHVNVLEAVPLE